MRRSMVIFCLFFICASGCGVAEEHCGIENCNGVDIVCGPNVPEVCSAMYGMGDFCRTYARCEAVEGECRLIKDPIFEVCAACVRECTDNFQNSPVEAFGCEAKCRERIEGAAEI